MPRARRGLKQGDLQVLRLIHGGDIPASWYESPTIGLKNPRNMMLLFVYNLPFMARFVIALLRAPLMRL